MILYFIEGTPYEVTLSTILMIMIPTLVVSLAFYVLRSIGIFMLAKKSSKGLAKIAYLAWIPFAWVYLACSLVGDMVIFGKPVKKFALIMVILFSVAGLFTFVYYFIQFFPLVGYYLTGEATIMFVDTLEHGMSGYLTYQFDEFILVGSNFQSPYTNLLLVGRIWSIIGLVSSLLDIVVEVGFIFFYIALFKKYWPKRFILATIWSIFGLFPIFAFVIRKNKETSYQEYVKENYERKYGSGNPFNPYQNYGQGGPQNPYYNNQNPRPPETPFSDFAEKGDLDQEPFPEFKDNDKKDN